MADMEKAIDTQGEAMQIVQQAAEIGLKVAEPHERINNKLIKALIWTNLFWALVLSLFIAFAYLAPAEMEQSQNIPEQSQSQVTRGIN